MKALTVQYRVRPEFVDANIGNIRKVMEALRADPVEGMQYASFRLDDGETFVHINMAQDTETMGKLNDIAAFKDFQAALKASNPLTPPKVTKLNLIGAAFDI
jgi:hypothetical protein